MASSKEPKEADKKPDAEPKVDAPSAGPIRAENGSFLPATYPCGEGMTRTDN